MTCLCLALTHAIAKTDDVLAHIRHNDNQVLQGSLTYNLTTHNLFGPQESNLTSNLDQYECITYTKEGYYKIVTQSSESRRNDVATIISNGHNTFYSIGNSINVHPKTSFIPGIPKNIAWLLTMIPGPCAYMGRGFTNIHHPMIAFNQKKVILQGYARDDSYIRAILDPTHGYVAKVIFRYTKDRKHLMSQWIIKSWRRSQDKVWIPSVVRCYLYDIQHGIRTEDISMYIHKASFQAPPSSAFNLSMKGKTVFDDRFGVPVGGKQEFPSESLDQVLQATGSVAHQLINLRNAAARAKSRKKIIEALVIGLFVYTLIAFIWTMRRKRAA